jgi:DNA helicase HerA-like ATPase
MLKLKQGASDDAKRALLVRAIEVLCRARGHARVSDLAALIESNDPGFRDAVGVLGKESPKLATQLRSLETLNRDLLAEEGETLDIERLLGVGPHAVTGRTHLSVLSTRFLDSEASVLFWVAQLLGELNRFAARRPSSTLQGLVMFDEADIYLPAIGQPATKAPMESLLKRARSAGLSVFLATQSPGDFDYKCRENVLTWFVGRIKEPRALEKLAPLAGAAGIDPVAAFPRQTVGQFHMITDDRAKAFTADRSLLRTEQLSEKQILELSRVPTS